MYTFTILQVKHASKYKINERTQKLKVQNSQIQANAGNTLNAARAFQLATSNVLPDRIVVNQSVPSRVNMLPNMCRHTFHSLS